MPKSVSSKAKNTGVQISSLLFRKKLQPVFDNKENSIDMGRLKNQGKSQEPEEKPQKVSTLKDPKEENLAPRRSKRRNALMDVVNTETTTEAQISKCAKVKSKKRAAETKKAANAVGKKCGKTNLTQAKLNFSSISLPTVKEEKPTVGNGGNANPQLDGTFCVTESLYQEVESPPGLILGEVDMPFDELLMAAKKDDTYELEHPTVQVLNENKKPSEEENILTSATPPDGYWKELAEQRRIALEKTLHENESLHDEIEVLKVENAQLRNLVQQAEEIATVVKGVLERESSEF